MRASASFHPEERDRASIRTHNVGDGRFIALHLDTSHDWAVLTDSLAYLASVAEAAVEGMVKMMEAGKAPDGATNAALDGLYHQMLALTHSEDGEK